MILSVGMIVKNEEKYLRMCLESLAPVIDEIGGELIITDTGSSDRTVEIAKEFTDKVYYFEWCDDYAKARNTTIKRAKGEWYMFVDADEILASPDEIIKFFKSGEYRSYDGATVIIRNRDEKSYSDFNALRMTKRAGGVKFYYPIHEGLYPVGERIKNIKAVFDHYGYVTGRAYTKKNKRYISSIKKAVEKYPEDIRMMAHLADAYGGGKDNYNALKTVMNAVSICKKGDYDICLLYEKAMRTCYNAGDYFQLIRIAEKYFRISKKEKVTNINIYTYLIYAYFREREYVKAIECFKKYDSLRGRILYEGFVTEEIASVVLELSDREYTGILKVLLYSYIETEDIVSAEKVIDKLYMMEMSEADIDNIIKASYSIYNKTGIEGIIIKLYKYLSGKGQEGMIYRFLCGCNFDNEKVFDIFRILYENTGELKYISGIYYSDRKNIRPDEEIIRGINKKAFPELIYFFAKYDIPVDDDIRHSVLERGRIPSVLSGYDDVCSVLFKYIVTESNAALKIIVCEGILGLCEGYDETAEVRDVYYGALDKMFEETMNLTEEYFYAADKITRLRYMYKRFYEARKNNDEKAVNEIKEKISGFDHLPDWVLSKLFV